MTRVAAAAGKVTKLPAAMEGRRVVEVHELVGKLRVPVMFIPVCYGMVLVLA